MKDRFEVIYKEVHSAGLEKRIIYVDKETGVNYLYVQNGYSGGLTPLLDADGKPVIQNNCLNRRCIIWERAKQKHSDLLYCFCSFRACSGL